MLIVRVDGLKVYYEMISRCRHITSQHYRLHVSKFCNSLLSFRKTSATTSDEHLEVEQLYRIGQVYNKVLDVWYEFIVLPSLLMGGAVTVICMYVSIRHTQLHLFIYWPSP